MAISGTHLSTLKDASGDVIDPELQVLNEEWISGSASFAATGTIVPFVGSVRGIIEVQCQLTRIELLAEAA